MSDVSLPYGNPPTQGWSGSETSKERAERDASSGIAAERQRRVLTYARVGGRDGVTVAEVRAGTGWHHGISSSTLSVLHKDGKLARLRERRARCAIYVLPENVAGRETAPHNANKKVTAAQYEEAINVIETMVGYLNERNGMAALNYGFLFLEGRGLR